MRLTVLGDVRVVLRRVVAVGDEAEAESAWLGELL